MEPFYVHSNSKYDSTWGDYFAKRNGDGGMEAMVKLEGPIQIINLLIENQVDNTMLGESFLILMI